VGLGAGSAEDGVEVHRDDLVPVFVGQLTHLGGAAADTCIVDADLQWSHGVGGLDGFVDDSRRAGISCNSYGFSAGGLNGFHGSAGGLGVEVLDHHFGSVGG